MESTRWSWPRCTWPAASAPWCIHSRFEEQAERTPDATALSYGDTRLSYAELNEAANRVEIEATVRTTGRTGVEMEALTAVSVAQLTVYDMVKAVDRGMRLVDARVVFKDGGKSGRWEAE